MTQHVIVGAGPVGSGTALRLAEAGHTVRVVTRSGTGPDHPLIELVAADATDADRLVGLATGADAIYNCANPAYHRWPTDWPPIATALLAAAERTGAGLVTMSNVYGYGPVDGPMTEDLPLAATTVKGGVRVRMWQDALAAHRAGRVRVTEARGSDFIGAGARSILSEVVLPKVRKGQRALAPVNFDLPHSLTFTGDASALLATLGTDDRAWGRAWHVPTAPAGTLREACAEYATLAGAPTPKLTRVPAAVIGLVGLASVEIRETVEMRYQFERPFVLDSTAAQQTFGKVATSRTEALRTLL